MFYALKYRTGEGRQRWHTIGRHGAPWTPDTARNEAQRLLTEVVQGKDPAAQKLAMHGCGCPLRPTLALLAEREGT